MIVSRTVTPDEARSWLTHGGRGACIPAEPGLLTAAVHTLATEPDRVRAAIAAAFRERAAAVRWSRENGLRPGEQYAPTSDSFEAWLNSYADTIENDGANP